VDELLRHIPAILLGWTALFFTIAIPGPAVLATIATSLSSGRQAGISMALGIVSISLFWACITAVGLGSLLLKYAIALTVLKVVAGIYLIWLAIKSFKSATSHPPELITTNINTQTPRKNFFLRGVFIHITNPKPIFAWIATLALSVTQTSSPVIYAVTIAGGVLISLTVNLSYAVSFSSDSVSRFYRKFHHWFETIFGTMFAAAGIKLILSAK